MSVLVPVLIALPIAMMAVFALMALVAGQAVRTAAQRGSPMPLSPVVQARVQALVDEGKLIPAIKLVRKETGMGLKDAKSYVDALSRQAVHKAPAGHTMPEPAPYVPYVPPAVQEAAYELVIRGKKINAVKLVIEQTGMGLKEGKAYVDWLSDHPPVPPAAAPQPAVPLSERVRAFRDGGDPDSAVALVQAETGMSRDEAIRFMNALQ